MPWNAQAWLAFEPSKFGLGSVFAILLSSPSFEKHREVI